MRRSLIFDIGANKGQNLEYYLLKAKKVVAVEANPVLAEEIRQQFKNEVYNGSLIVMDVVLTDDKAQGQVDFFVHRSNHVLSTFVPPTDLENYSQIKASPMSVAQLVAAFGCPDYLKVDVEHYDHIIANAFFDIGCFPSEISIEAHTRKSMDILLKNQHYGAFRIVDGSRVAKDYDSHHISVNDGRRLFQFPAIQQALSVKIYGEPGLVPNPYSERWSYWDSGGRIFMQTQLNMELKERGQRTRLSCF